MYPPQGFIAPLLDVKGKVDQAHVWFPAVVIGVEWNQPMDTWRRIDINGNTITPMPYLFDELYPWAGIIRVTMRPEGLVNTFGVDGRGSNLALDGTDGRVMVQIPIFWVRFAMPVPNVYQWWISPVPRSGFELHPAFVQRGGVVRNFIYVGAYEADLEYSGPAGAYSAVHEKLHSASGRQPITGGQIWRLSFTGGANEPAIGDILSTPSNSGWIVVDYLLESGTWAAGTAVGRLWLRKPGDDALGFLHGETITNHTPVPSVTLGIVNITGAGGERTAMLTRIGDCRTWAGNIGAGWGQENIWTLSARQLLLYVEYAGADSQTLIGEGIVRKPSGIGFAGELTGHDGIDANLAVNGTGTGIGANGFTPISYRGVENPWGNIWTFGDGWNSWDAHYRIIRRDGTGIFADTILSGDYEASAVVPVSPHGWISNIESEDLLKYLFVASETLGSSTTFLYDHFWVHTVGRLNILLSGAGWDSGVGAGVACRGSFGAAALSTRHVGARLEFIG